LKKLIVSLATDGISYASLTAFGDYPRIQNATFFIIYIIYIFFLWVVGGKRYCFFSIMRADSPSDSEGQGRACAEKTLRAKRSEFEMRSEAEHLKLGRWVGIDF
jgi:hypothetical protein